MDLNKKYYKIKINLNSTKIKSKNKVSYYMHKLNIQIKLIFLSN